MEYNFYDTLAFLERIKKPLENEKIVINDRTINFCEINSLDIPNEFISHVEIYNLLDYMWKPLDRFDAVCWQLEGADSLACAIDYDQKVHPDETVFISNSPALRDIANRFFGDDSIKPYKPTRPVFG